MKLPIVLIVASLSSSVIAAPAQVDLGPEPTWEQAVQLGNQEITSRLIDPESARIAWPYALIGGTLKALFGKTRAGWYTCGFVNARNRMGGFTGTVPFLVMFRDNAVQSLDIGESDGVDAATVTCNDLSKRGLLSPSGAGVTPTPVAVGAAVPTLQAIQAAGEAGAAAAAKQGGIGISFLPSPAGIVLLAVAPNSPAAVAGLKSGQVIQSVNGIDLRGMQQAAAVAVIHGLPKQIKFDVIGSGSVNVTLP